MTLNEADREIEEAERDADPQRFGGRRSHDIERVVTASSVSTASSAAGHASRRTAGMSRVPTQPDLERHPTALNRINTLRSQHTNTVGRHPTHKTRIASTRPLPNFGAGKPYPPALPEREEYVPPCLSCFHLSGCLSCWGRKLGHDADHARPVGTWSSSMAQMTLYTPRTGR